LNLEPTDYESAALLIGLFAFSDFPMQLVECRRENVIDERI